MKIWKVLLFSLIYQEPEHVDTRPIQEQTRSLTDMIEGTVGY